MKKIVTILICLIIVLIAVVSVAQEYRDLPEGKPASNWQNLDKASALIRTPGTKFIICWNPESISYDFNYLDTRNYEVWVYHENRKRVRILNHAWWFIGESVAPGGQHRMFEGVVYPKPSKEEINEHVYLKRLMADKNGLRIIPNDEVFNNGCWFGNTGLWANLEEKLDKSITDPKITNTNKFKASALHLYSADGELVKSIPLPNIKRAGSNWLKTSPEGVTLLTQSYLVKHPQTVEDLDIYFITSTDCIEKPFAIIDNAKNNEYNYFCGNFKLNVGTPKFELVSLGAFDLKGKIAEINPNQEVWVQSTCTVIRKAQSSEFEMFDPQHSSTLLGYDKELNYAHLAFWGQSDWGISKFNLKTGENEVLHTKTAKESNIKFFNLTYDNNSDRYFFLSKRTLGYYGKDLKPKTLLKFKYLPEMMYVLP